MLRQTAIALVFSMLPASALACGMYLPPENDKLLAEILEEIDQTANQDALAAVEAAKVVQAADVAPVEKTETPSVIPEVAAVVQPAS